MKRFLSAMLSVLVVGLLAPLSSHAADPLWEVLVYSLDTNDILAVSPQGVYLAEVQSPLTVPADGNYADFRLSDDRRFLAVTYATDRPYLQIADLTLQTFFDIPLTFDPRLQTFDAFFLGDFDPTNTQIAVGYVGYSAVEASPQLGGIMTIAAATGTITHQLTDVNAMGGFAVQMDDWTAAGVEFLPSCWACGGVLDGYFNLWQPETNTVTVSSEYVNLIGGSPLKRTGEMLLATANQAFPASPEMGMIPYSNVVEYYAANELPLRASDPSLPAQIQFVAGQIVFFDPNQLELATPQWVLDGQAFFLTSYDSTLGTVVYRDGRQQTLPLTGQPTFLAGTTDGWLMIDESQMPPQLQHYTLTGGHPQLIPLGQMPLTYQVLQSPNLGVNAGGRFTTKLTPPVAITCPNFLPSRLMTGQIARVTPGGPNNFRAEPSLSAVDIGDIPGGAEFWVRQGPVCADGMAWWMVEYNGTIGWTSEGSSNEYWLEP